jgi:phasin
MPETTTAATKAKTTKPLPNYGMPKFEMPKFDLPNMEMPEALREMAEKGAAHARDTCAKAKVASEETAELLENAYSSVAKSGANYNLKLFEIARTNTRAAFEYAHELLGVRSASELITLSTAHARKQFDIVSAQNKELCALAQEAAAEAVEPIKTGAAKAFNKET